MSRSRRILSTRELNRAIRARQELRIAAKSPSRKRNPDRDTYEVLESTRIGRPSWGASKNVSPAPNHGDLVLVRTDDAGRRGRGRRSSRRRLRRRAGRSAAVIAGSCGGSCPSAAAGRRGQLMRDVSTRRRDWRRLTLAKGSRPPLRWCCLSAVVLAVGCASTTTMAAHPLSGSTTVRPWSQPVAPAVPETHRVHPGSLGRFSDCVATAAAQPPGGGTPAGLVGADDRPSGAELSWLPGREISGAKCYLLVQTKSRPSNSSTTSTQHLSFQPIAPTTALQPTTPSSC